MTMNYARVVNAGSVASRVRGNSTWAMIDFVFNGMVFILLGLQFPHILGRALLDAHETSNAQVWRLVGYVAAVAGALYAMRFVWVWLLRYFASRSAAKQGVANAVPGLRTAAVTTVAGVRGAVTLAGVLSLPEVLPGGAALPGRDLAIFIASGVILVSLIVAVVALPLLLSGWRRGKDPHAAEEALARTMAAQAAIRAVDEVHDRECANLDESASAYAADVTARVMDLYQRRLATLDEEREPRELARRADALEFRMKLAAMRAERKTLLELRSSQEINDETLNKLMREVDLSETALTARRK
jgi:CPA1 family monovalent cation:H+ antiporter